MGQWLDQTNEDRACRPSRSPSGKETALWLGYLHEYPDYWTQGETEDDLKEHLREIYKDLTSGEIPGIRCDRVAS